MAAKGRCPECGTPVGGNTGVSPYKHMVACLHVPPMPPELIRSWLSGKPEAYSERVLALLYWPEGG